METRGGMVVVECHGVGYAVLVPSSSLVNLPAGEEAILHTRQIFREDTQFLVGFCHAGEAELFDLLTEVKGCGPKIALQVISDLGEEPVILAISTEDAKALAKANGVGPRLAERIILELKEKVRQSAWARRTTAAATPARAVAALADDELLEALLALGYKRTEAEAMCAQAGDPGLSLEDRLKAALRSVTR